MAQTIVIPEGVHEWHNALKPPADTLITGDSRSGTIINWHWSFDHHTGSGNAIVPADGCTIENLTINCVLASNHQGAIGCRVQDGDAPFHGVLLRNCTLNGLSDCLYLRHEEACSLTVENCLLTTKWDLVMLAGALHDVTIKNCTMLANGTGYIINGSMQEVNTTTVVGGKLSVSDSYLQAIHPTMNTRGLWTVGQGELGFVAGSSITATRCYVSAKELIVEAEETTIATVETDFPGETKLYIERLDNDAVIISWWSEKGYLYDLEGSSDLKVWSLEAHGLPGIDGKIKLARRIDLEQRYFRLRIYQ